MTDIINALKEYFENTPKEQLEKELAELEKFNQIGPDVLESLILSELHSKEFMDFIDKKQL